MSEDDEPCTCCEGTGITIQTERRCACQPPEIKCSSVMSVDGATLTVRRSGYCQENGSGYFVLDENDVDWKPHDERDGHYLEVKLAPSEMIELRDFLNREFPPESTK
jgi:hypothetical protein